MPGNGVDLLIDEAADIVVTIEVDLDEQIIVASRRIDLRGNFGIDDSGRDRIGLAKLAFDLNEKGLHWRIPGDSGHASQGSPPGSSPFGRASAAAAPQ